MATTQEFMAQCYKCNSVEVAEEFQRCPSCEQTHKELAKKLDSKPRVKVKKVKEELFPIYEVKQGIKVTTWIDRSDAAAMGIKLPLNNK